MERIPGFGLGQSRILEQVRREETVHEQEKEDA